MTKTKSDIIHELIRGLEVDSTGSTLNGELKCVTHAPQLGYLSWIFKYKGVLVAVSDMGNGHFSYDYPVNKIDVLIARICYIVERRSSK